jgi:predicted enzyme related to lactoylglutathione lyase
MVGYLLQDQAIISIHPGTHIRSEKPEDRKMKVTQSAISLNVADVAASAQFVTIHLGFSEEMAFEGGSSLSRPDVPFNLVFLQTGLASFKPKSRAGAAGDGLLIVFVVEDIDGEYARLQEEGARIITPIGTEPWGERYFQLQDANGIVYQLVQWT